VLLNLFYVAAHFSPRLLFWAHFTQNVFQNIWLGVIIALSRNISPPTCRSFAAHRWRSTDIKYIFSAVNSWHPLFFRASASCSKFLNVKCIFNTVKTFRATLFFMASASCSKILNGIKCIFRTVNSRHLLIFKASASGTKLLNVESIFNTVKISGQLFFRAGASCSKILNGKKYTQCSEKFQGKLCFQGKRKLLQILNVRSIFNATKIFKTTLFLQGKRKLLKNRERWKNFQYSVYSHGGDPCNLG